MAEIKVECPCCKAELILDAATGGIINHKAYKEAPPSLDDFLKNEKSRNAALDEKFASSKEREEAKKDLLDKKFEWAKKNKDKLPEAPKPDLFWD
jgi:hypothetical protein